MVNGVDVTVIVPVYNGEKYVRRCLDYLMKQTANNYMVYCVDDGSTDNSLIILNEYARKYNNVIVYSKTNGGLSSARNYGLKYVKTPYVMFVDCDDYVDENFVKKMHEKIISENADIVSCGLVKENALNEMIVPLWDENKQVIEVETSPDVICTMNVTACNKIFRVQLFEEICFPEGYVFEDSMTTPRLVARSRRVVYIPDILYHYVMSPNSITRGADPHLADRKKIVEVLFEDDYYEVYKEQFSYLVLSDLYGYIYALFDNMKYRTAVNLANESIDLFAEVVSNCDYSYCMRFNTQLSFWGKMQFQLIDKRRWRCLKIFQLLREIKKKKRPI